jgi:hypothetical protein
LGGVTYHTVISTFLIFRESELIPYMHPVTVLTVDALTTDLDLNLGDHLLTREVKPPSIHTVIGRWGVTVR